MKDFQTQLKQVRALQQEWLDGTLGESEWDWLSNWDCMYTVSHSYGVAYTATLVGDKLQAVDKDYCLYLAELGLSSEDLSQDIVVHTPNGVTTITKI